MRIAQRLMFLGALLLAAPNLYVYGQIDFNSKLSPHIEKSKIEYAKRSKSEKKLVGGFYKLLLNAEAADTSVKSNESFKKQLKYMKVLEADSQNRIKVVLDLTSVQQSESVINLIKKLEGTIESIGQNIPYITCRIHPAMLRKLASSSSIVLIRHSIPGIKNSIVSAGDIQLKANLARDQFSVAGYGVSVGVISNGVDNLAEAQSNFELGYVDVRNAGSGNEGTAMLEIIHDLAPQADLYFNDAGTNYTEFADKITTLKNFCDIIVDDVKFPDEPYFTDEDWTLGFAIRDYLLFGGVYISSAGNSNYSIENNPKGYSIFSGISNFGPDNLHEFSSNQKYIDFTVDGYKQAQIYVQWATSWNTPLSDYNLYIFDENDNLMNDGIIVSGGTDVQSGGNNIPPRERIVLNNESENMKHFKLVIKLMSGDDADTPFKINIRPPEDSPEACKLTNHMTNNEHTYGHSGYPNVISVAAYNAELPNQMATYSSGGPLWMYSTESNEWSNQQTPLITATSGVSTFVGSNGYWKKDDGTNNEPFYGTSASAPHIAAIAALYFSEYSTHTRSDFIEALKNTAVSIEGDGGNGTWHVNAGYGKADALACLNYSTSSPILSIELLTYAGSASGGVRDVIVNNSGSGSFNWTASTTYSWITITNGTGIPGDAFTFEVDQNTGPPRSGTITVAAPGATGSPLTITINQEQGPGKIVEQVDSEGTRFGLWSLWNRFTNQWDEYSSGPRPLNNNTIYYFLAHEDFKPNSNEKFYYWGNNLDNHFWQNYAGMKTRSKWNNIKAQFETAHNITIQTRLEGFSSLNQGEGKVQFQDPWLADEYEPIRDKDRNRAESALMSDPKDSPFSPSLNSEYMGVFLNHPYSRDGINYYVQVPLTQQIYNNNSHFLNWYSDDAILTFPNDLYTSLIFTAPDAIIYADYKATHKANNIDALENNSQRKIIRTPDDILHMVYESMGRVWYERSSNDGDTWELVSELNNGYNAKNPSIDFMWDEPSQMSNDYKKVSIVYDGDTGLGTYGVYLENYFLIDNEYLTFGRSLLSNPNNLFAETHDSNPVIALGVEQKMMTVWINEQNELMCGYGIIQGLGGFGGWHTGYPKEIYTDGNPVGEYFSLISTKDYDYSDLSIFYLGVELKPTGISETKVILSTLKAPDYNQLISGAHVFEDKDINSYPSISLINTGTKKIPFVVWMGKDFNSEFSGYAKVIDEWPHISSPPLGTNVTSIQSSTPKSGDEGVVVWTEENSSSIKYVSYQSPLFSSPGQLSESNSGFSLSIGADNIDQLSAYNVDNTTLPYSIDKTELTPRLPETISSDFTLASGTYQSDCNLTINTGVTLTIESGVNIIFQNDASLIVNGTLDVNGALSNKVVFDFVSQNSTLKNGIKINTGGTGSIDYAIIKNAYNGVYVDEATVNINNSEIFNCYYGVHLYRTNYVSYPSSYITNTHSYDNEFGVVMYYSKAHLSYNEFNNNWIGLGCADYSSPYLAMDDNNSESYGYNNIHHNDHGVYAYGYSNPFLGRETCVSYGGNNTIANNNSYEVYMHSNSNIYAENNYWGVSSPSASQFNIGSGCSLDYTPYLSSQPQPSKALVRSPEDELFDSQFDKKVANNTSEFSKIFNKDKPSGFDNKWRIEWKLLYARNLIRVKKNNFAADICEDILTEFADSSFANLALDLLWQARSSNKDAKKLFKQFVKDKAKSTKLKQVYGAAELLLAGSEDENRIFELDRITEKYKGTPLVEFVLFQKFMYYLYEENNIELAKTTSDDLGRLFPESESYFDSQRHLGNKVELKFAKNTLNEESEEIPATYELLGNYPNPFNPSTTISYALPFESSVTIEIYNITGKLIQKFESQNEHAGYHHFNWYGKNRNHLDVASGIYIYKFTAKSLESNEVFSKSNKMMLLR
jgi:hypothetical protein